MPTPTCDGTCPDGRYCAEHGDLAAQVPEGTLPRLDVSYDVPEVYDWLGRRIEVGSRVVYPVAHSSNVSIVYARVTYLAQRSSGLAIKVQPTYRNGRGRRYNAATEPPVWIRRVDRLTVVSPDAPYTDREEG
jgi:hypothetical protein